MSGVCRIRCFLQRILPIIVRGLLGQSTTSYIKNYYLHLVILNKTCVLKVCCPIALLFSKETYDISKESDFVIVIVVVCF